MRDDQPRQPTFTGKRINVLDLAVVDVCIEDVAHHLSQLNRFVGATDDPYSVAQHSVYVSRFAPSSLRLAALLHDAAEAYTGDLSHPIKHQTNVGDPYRRIEARLNRVIEQAFGLDAEQMDEPEIKAADDRVFDIEWECLIEKRPDRTLDITPWSYEDAEARFLREHEWLVRLRG